jgi:GTP-binding protein
MLSSAQPPILAIVGRPNVGKSTLFNRIVGQRVAIVHKQPGVTRDRVSGIARRAGKTFEVVDTGGISVFDHKKIGDVLAAAALRQAEIAIGMAGAIILVVDVTEGLTPLDIEIARQLRASGKKILLAVNKADNPQRDQATAEFAALGFDRVFSISAAHGHGVDELVAEATAGFPAAEPTDEQRPVRIAIVGRPNVGKSSLINHILQSDRAIVSEIPGTTRDSIDVPFTLADGDARRHYILVDTAGLRHKRKIRSSVDQFGLMRAERSIRQADLSVLVLDAAAGVTKQDKKIAGQIVQAGCGCVILVNKWDLAAAQEAASGRAGQPPRPGHRRSERPKTFRDEYLEALRRELFFLDWAPVLFASAKTGQNLDALFRLVQRVESELDRRMDTPQLNKVLPRALETYPPPFIHGKRLKIFYAFQKSSRPPTVAMFVNDARCLTPHYERFLVDRLRAAWGFEGCPLVLECRQRQRRK